jgi:hypothetical protein
MDFMLGGLSGCCAGFFANTFDVSKTHFDKFYHNAKCSIENIALTGDEDKTAAPR